MESRKKNIVISGPNLIDGGPLSVYYDFLDAIIQGGYNEKFNVIALVGRKELFSTYSNKISLIEYPKSKKNWFFRLYYEYYCFNRLSKKLNTYIWISMHDITPNVHSQKLYVYCHNPSPFNKMHVSDVKYGVKYYLFSKLYKYLYKINIKKATGVIVQQDWMRQSFKKMYGINNIIVARPTIGNYSLPNRTSEKRGTTVFIAPSFPRYYKNFELSCIAAKKLTSIGYTDFKLVITLSGDENSYSKMLKAKYGEIKQIRFIGLLKRNDLYQYYSNSDCLIFMSKLETWGMPITEYKKTNNSMILADLPYAHETVGSYEGVEFVDVDDADELVIKMKDVINNGCLYGKSTLLKINPPYVEGWSELCKMILM